MRARRWRSWAAKWSCWCGTFLGVRFRSRVNPNQNRDTHCNSREAPHSRVCGWDCMSVEWQASRRGFVCSGGKACGCCLMAQSPLCHSSIEAELSVAAHSSADERRCSFRARARARRVGELPAVVPPSTCAPMFELIKFEATAPAYFLNVQMCSMRRCSPHVTGLCAAFAPGGELLGSYKIMLHVCT